MKEFLGFIRKQGVVGLAVGFVLGGAVSKVVASIVSDLVTPVVGVALGAVGNLKDAYLQIGPAKIMWGSFVNTLIDFVVIAFVVYFGVKAYELFLGRLDRK